MSETPKASVQRKLREQAAFVRYIVYSAYASDESRPIGGRPQSVFFIAQPGHAKTETLERYKVNANVRFFSDITLKQLYPVLRQALPRGQATHVCVTEFQKIIARKREVANNFLATMLQAMEEGVDEVGLGPHLYKLGGARLGLLAASTTTSIRQHPFLVRELAMDSRMYLIDASLSHEEIRALEQLIANGARHLIQPIKCKLPDKPVRVTCPPAISNRVRAWVREMDARGCKTYGVRTFTRFLRTLYGVALANGRTRVGLKDLSDLYALKRFWLEPPDVDALYQSDDTVGGGE